MGGWNDKLTISVERDVIVGARSVYHGDIYVRPNYFQPQQQPQPPTSRMALPKFSYRNRKYREFKKFT